MRRRRYALTHVTDKIEVGMTIDTIHGPAEILDIYIDMDDTWLEIRRTTPSGEIVIRPMMWKDLTRYLDQ